MKIRESFGAVERLSITVLVDNKADLIVESNDQVKYFKDRPLLAEHGFSALIRLDDQYTILWDAGVSRVALLENLRRMEIDTTQIDMLALSHGHSDHFAGLLDVLLEMDLGSIDFEWQSPPSTQEVQQRLNDRRIPLVVHPAAFRERWWRKEDGTLVGPFNPPPIGAWESAGARLILSETPYQLAPGCWTTGYVPRRSFEDVGRPADLLYREGDEFLHDDLDEDQAILINVNGKGLVVLTGCAHSGVINTVEYAREISGVERVLAVIGGFHLSKAKEEDIQRTIERMNEIDPQQLIPCHCTGFKAMRRIAEQIPESFIEGIVGATYEF